MLPAWMVSRKRFQASMVFMNLGVESEVVEGREVLKKLPGGGALRCDRVWERFEPWGPNSWPKPWFCKRLPLRPKKTFLLSTQKKFCSVCTEMISSVRTEEIHDQAVESWAWNHCGEASEPHLMNHHNCNRRVVSILLSNSQLEISYDAEWLCLTTGRRAFLRARIIPQLRLLNKQCFERFKLGTTDIECVIRGRSKSSPHIARITL